MSHGFKPAAMKVTDMPEYWVWASMRSRCRRPSCRYYESYGGRGISVAPQWESFKKFLADVGRRPSPDHSIDRIDNDGNYEPGNVRWSTRREQQNNRRTNHLVVYQGKQMTIAEAARAGGMGITTEHARSRIHHGWEVERAVETAPLYRRTKTEAEIET